MYGNDDRMMADLDAHDRDLQEQDRRERTEGHTPMDETSVSKLVDLIKDSTDAYHAEEICSHLGAALMQTIPTDDQIIIGHVRAAQEHAKKMRREFAIPTEQQMHHHTEARCWKCGCQVKHYRGLRRFLLAKSHYVRINGRFVECKGSHRPNKGELSL